MRLAVVTDEIDVALDAAARVAAELGIRGLELRTVDGVNVVDLDPGGVRRVRDVLRAGGFDCTGIASPFLKCNPDEEQDGILERALHVAAELDAPFVRCFSWWRESQPDALRPRLLPVLQQAAARCREAGIPLLLENEHACNIATAQEAAWYLERAPDLALIWDPGNHAWLGTPPFPAGYEAVRGRIGHVHVKDVADGPTWVVAGEGVCDWPAQVKALAADGYRGALSIETHIHEPSPAAASRSAVKALRAVAVGTGVSLS
jgi:L-ribulose-5-phosphate 3-epimerase